MRGQRNRKPSQQTDDRMLAMHMRAAQSGDAQAYAKLLRVLTPRLRHIIANRRRSLQPSDVEDLVQDVLLSLHAVRATYDPERPFMPWLLAIAHNRLADSARRYARHTAREIEMGMSDVTFSEPATNTDMQTYGAQTYGDPQALRRAIRALPPGQRQAVEMLKLSEMSLKEAAAASGMTIGTLKVSVHRAMTALRKALTKE